MMAGLMPPHTLSAPHHLAYLLRYVSEST